MGMVLEACRIVLAHMDQWTDLTLNTLSRFVTCPCLVIDSNPRSDGFCDKQTGKGERWLEKGDFPPSTLAEIIYH